MIFLYRKSNIHVLVIIRLSFSEIPKQNFGRNIKHNIVHILWGTAWYIMFIWFPNKPVL